METDRLQQITDDAHQLALLLPKITAALAKDYAPGDGRGGNNPTSIPVNPEVLDAIRELHADIPTRDLELRQALTFNRAVEVQRRTPIKAALDAPNLYRRLTAHAELRERADDYADTVHHWKNTARTAIGLNKPPRGIGEPCPYCKTTELLTRGDTATLNGTINATADTATITHPGNNEAITWRRGDLIYCPDCHASWPPHTWDFLFGMLRAAKEAAIIDAEEELCEYCGKGETEDNPIGCHGGWPGHDDCFEMFLNEAQPIGSHYDEDTGIQEAG